jgi:hypothetical protein
VYGRHHSAQRTPGDEVSVWMMEKPPCFIGQSYGQILQNQGVIRIPGIHPVLLRATKIFIADHPSLRLDLYAGWDRKSRKTQFRGWINACHTHGGIHIHGTKRNKGWSPRNRVTHTHVPSAND